MKIALLLSGGVDSSVALHKLVAAGHDVTAFYIKIWLEDDFAFLGTCPWEEDVRYARQTCDALGVALRVVSLQREYHERVVAATIDAVAAGVTPNPDMLCNREVKFGIFDKRYGAAFDLIASGHYARVSRDADGTARLFCAPDPVKDQTYFLAMLGQHQLRRVTFPIGRMRKSDVRAYARAHGLPAAERKDSQGICFLGKISFHDFVKARLGVRPGVFVEQETGLERGTHDGFYFYTIGQRHGVTVPNGPWYVCGKDAARNIVYITHGYTGADQRRDTFDVAQITTTVGAPLRDGVFGVKIRHGAYRYDATVRVTAPASARVTLASKDDAVTPGQYAVFYAGDECLGGGVIA